jgi:FMN reductase
MDFDHSSTRRSVLRTFSSVVGVAGNITRPSRTASLVSILLSEIAAGSGAQTRLIELVDIAPELFQSVVPEPFESFASRRLSPRARFALQAIEAADALVVGTPVYKGSYTGALKHLFDLIPPNALAGKLVLLAATGGTPLHGLVIEQELRPLFGFFRALTIPASIFALESDFKDHRVEQPALVERVCRAAGEMTELLATRAPRVLAQAELATA